jgi:hypothetical protein
LLDKNLHNCYIIFKEVYKPCKTQLEDTMHTTQDERGILNNFAAEPTLYFAEAPSAKQQRRYLIQGAAAMALVASLLGIALTVS